MSSPHGRSGLDCSTYRRPDDIESRFRSVMSSNRGSRSASSGTYRVTGSSRAADRALVDRDADEDGQERLRDREGRLQTSAVRSRRSSARRPDGRPAPPGTRACPCAAGTRRGLAVTQGRSGRSTRARKAAGSGRRPWGSASREPESVAHIRVHPHHGPSDRGRSVDEPTPTRRAPQRSGPGPTPPAGFGGANGGGAWVAASSSPPRGRRVLPGTRSGHHSCERRYARAGGRTSVRGPGNLAPTLVGAVGLGLGRASQLPLVCDPQAGYQGPHRRDPNRRAEWLAVAASLADPTVTRLSASGAERISRQGPGRSFESLPWRTDLANA